MPVLATGDRLTLNVITIWTVGRVAPEGWQIDENIGIYIQESHGSILALRSRRKLGKKTVQEGEALPFRSQQQSLRATALLNRPAEGANMTRRPGLAHLHGEERWRWPLR